MAGLVVLCSTFPVGCTTLIAGRNATVDGSVLATHSNDGEANVDPRLVHVPARDHPKGARRAVHYSPESFPRYVGFDRGVPEYYPVGDQKPWEPLGYIPEVARTYAYHEQTYGAINEHAIGIGESTCSGRFGALPRGRGGHALFSVDQLTQVAMERAKTARGAVQLMGDLAVEHGFYGAGNSTEGSAESLMVIDPTEAFIFHILPDDTGKSAIWVAQRVPDDHVGVVANAFMVRHVDLNDTFNFMGSANMHAIAKAHGFWDGRGLLDFTAAFSDGEYLHKFYSGRRVWGAYQMLAPSSGFLANYDEWRRSSPYPATVRPDTKVGVDDFAAVMRSYYEGTDFDQTRGLAAGPWGSPDHAMAGGSKGKRGNWERTIGLWRTSDSHIVQARANVPKKVAGVLWWGPHAAATTVRVPFPSGLSSLPKVALGHYEELDKETLFWACRYVFNIAQLKYARMILEVRKVQAAAQANGLAVLHATAKRNAENSDLSARDFDNAFATHAFEVVDRLWRLVDHLIFTFGDGFVVDTSGAGYTATSDPYPDWWLDAVNFSSGPPPVTEAAIDAAGPVRGGQDAREAELKSISEQPELWPKLSHDQDDPTTLRKAFSRLRQGVGALLWTPW